MGKRSLVNGQLHAEHVCRRIHPMETAEIRRVLLQKSVSYAVTGRHCDEVSNVVNSCHCVGLQPRPQQRERRDGLMDNSMQLEVCDVMVVSKFLGGKMLLQTLGFFVRKKHVYVNMERDEPMRT